MNADVVAANHPAIRPAELPGANARRDALGD